MAEKMKSFDVMVYRVVEAYSIHVDAPSHQLAIKEAFARVNQKQVRSIRLKHSLLALSINGVQIAVGINEP